MQAQIQGLYSHVLWIPLLPLLASCFVYPFRRYGVGPWIAAIASFGTALLVSLTPVEDVYVFFGRQLSLDPLARAALFLLFFFAGFSFILAGRIPQGRIFPVMGLFVLSILSAAALSEHPGIAALLFEVAVLSSILFMQGGEPGASRAPLRFLVMMTLALPVLLLAGWQIDFAMKSTGIIMDARRLAMFAGVGFALWLGLFPFHGWVTAIASDSPPIVASFTLWSFPTTAMLVLLRLVGRHEWLVANPEVASVMLWGGAITALVGGLFAAPQRSLGLMMGYAAMYDMGCAVVAMAAPPGWGGLPFYAMMAARALALLPLGCSTASLRREGGGDSFEEVSGLGRRLPFSSLGLLVGGLALAAMPFTFAFTLRVPLYVSLYTSLKASLDASLSAGGYALAMAAMSLGSVGVGIGYVRAFALLVRPGQPEPSGGESGHAYGHHQEDGVTSFIVLLFAAVTLLLSLYPQLVVYLADKVDSLYRLPPI